MDETKKIIADMVCSMSFERKKPVSKQTKQEVAVLYDALGKIKAKVDKLHLALWHAQEKSDYHSLTLEEAKRELKQIRDEIDNIC